MAVAALILLLLRQSWTLAGVNGDNVPRLFRVRADLPCLVGIAGRM